MLLRRLLRSMSLGVFLICLACLLIIIPVRMLILPVLNYTAFDFWADQISYYSLSRCFYPFFWISNLK